MSELGSAEQEITEPSSAEPSEFGFLEQEAADVGLQGPIPRVRRETVQTGSANTGPSSASTAAISALAWGDAPPRVSFLHGAGLNAHTWDATILALGEPAVALDLPGHGDSGWRSDADYSPRTIAPAIAEAVIAMGAAGTVLVGQSLGGLAAAVVAAATPGIARGLVIVDISPGLDPRTGASQVREFLAGPADFSSRDEIVDRAIAFGFGPSREDVSRGVFLNTRVREDGRVVWKHHFANLGGLIPAGEASFTPIWDDLAAIDVPIMLIAGSRGVLSEAQRAEFQERLPRATTVTIDAGHNIQEDAPVELAAAIRGFMARTA